jgi:nitrate/nitrite-specific signal transduction histidine kinase
MIARADEVGELAEAFNHMAEQLQSSFAALEQVNQELEQRVAERTASLAASERLNRSLLDAVPDILASCHCGTTHGGSASSTGYGRSAVS